MQEMTALELQECRNCRLGSGYSISNPQLEPQPRPRGLSVARPPPLPLLPLLPPLRRHE